MYEQRALAQYLFDTATKVDNLEDGNGVPELSADTVDDDGNANFLKGGSGSDWFFEGAYDVLDNYKADKDFLTEL